MHLLFNNARIATAILGHYVYDPTRIHDVVRAVQDIAVPQTFSVTRLFELIVGATADNLGPKLRNGARVQSPTERAWCEYVCVRYVDSLGRIRRARGTSRTPLPPAEKTGLKQPKWPRLRRGIRRACNRRYPAPERPRLCFQGICQVCNSLRFRSRERHRVQSMARDCRLPKQFDQGATPRHDSSARRRSACPAPSNRHPRQ